MSIPSRKSKNETIQRNRIRRQSLSHVGLARDDEVDFERFVVVSFDIKIVNDMARLRRRLIAVITVAATAGRSTAAAMDRKRRFLPQNGKIVTIWTQNLIISIFTTKKEL